jgi:ArsR family transcriptional regulator
MNGLSNATVAPEAVSIFDRLSAVADPLRCRVLLVLERHELTVSELCSVLQLPQSTVSRHLKVLADDGWVRARPEGTRRLYTAAESSAGSVAGDLWRLVRSEVGASPTAADDRRRLDGVLANRRTKSQEFFASAAGEWAEMRRELFGQRFDLHALLGLLDREAVVGDLGAGTGQVAEALAPFVGRVVAVDHSEAMLDAARARLADASNVDVRAGRLEALPIADGELDAALLGLVLHHMPDPDAVLAEAARALRPGGRLLIVEMYPHDHEDYRQRMGHVWLGFSEEQIERWCAPHGFENIHFHSLPTDPHAKGPTLFVASAAKSGS